MIRPKNSLIVLVLFVLQLGSSLFAQQNLEPYSIDATVVAPPPVKDFLHMGGVSPSGQRLEVNSRYLSIGGKPLLPVMGEFQFSRYPEQYWAEELQKMKAGGVSVVATYVFWIHQEEVEGEFDWTGRRDLRSFLELCKENGMYVWLRIGPWAHGEARNGGFPDWLIAKHVPLRRNDPEYLMYVTRYFDEMGKQTRGMFWQEGGPIIGVQFENEYSVDGPDGGAAHIAELKRIAKAAGIDAPLSSIFSGRPDFPQQEFIPFTGGYPDKFWTRQTTDIPPSSLYLFSARRQRAAEMGAIGTGTTADITNDPSLYRQYPLFAAEMAGGMESSYQRRPLMDADDIAALTLTRLGSGVNLYGYYVFHGGSNPDGKLTTLQESTATGYPNDMPVVSYDFQAPLSQYGQERESFRRVKTLHLFLKSFGSDLAPMTTYLLDKRPINASDNSVPRFDLRADGSSGYLFVNNYVRKLNMLERKEFQVRIKFPAGDGDVPRKPIDIPANSYFIWPVNLSLSVGTLQYSTAQLLSRFDGNGKGTYFFFAIPGITPEFSFDGKTVASVTANSGRVRRSGDSILLEDARPGRDSVVSVSGKNGKVARIVLLTEEEAENFWQLQVGNYETIILSAADVFAGPEGIHLRSTDPAKIRALTFSVSAQGQPIWREKNWQIAPRKIKYTWSSIRKAGNRQLRTDSAESQPEPRLIAPQERDFSKAAVWNLTIPGQSMKGLSDIELRIRYAGDIARLYDGDRLLGDNFYNGAAWEIGLKRFLPSVFEHKMLVEVLPMPENKDMYLDPAAWAKLPSKGPVANVNQVELLPEYEVVMQTK